MKEIYQGFFTGERALFHGARLLGVRKAYHRRVIG